MCSQSLQHALVNENELFKFTVQYEYQPLNCYLFSGGAELIRGLCGGLWCEGNGQVREGQTDNMMTCVTLTPTPTHAVPWLAVLRVASRSAPTVAVHEVCVH